MARLLPAVNLFVFLAIPALVWHMWPILHLSPIPGRVDGFFSSFHARSAPKNRAACSWFSGSSVAFGFGARPEELQDSRSKIGFVNLEEALTVMWVRQWQRREIAKVGAVILAVFCLAFITRLLAVAQRPRQGGIRAAMPVAWPGGSSCAGQGAVA
jgi:hypothetical protein